MKQPYSQSTLKNKAELYVIQTPETPVVNLKLTFECGYLQFDKYDHHLPHLLEHLLIGASKDSPTEAVFDTKLRRFGANANAATSDDELLVTLRAPRDTIVQALEVVLESVFNANITSSALDQQRAIIEREIYERFDSYVSSIQAETMEKVLPEQFMGSMDEHIESLEDLSLKKVRAAYKAHIMPQAVKVLIAGSLPTAAVTKIKRAIEAYDNPADAKPPKVRPTNYNVTQSVLAEAIPSNLESGFLSFCFVERIADNEPVRAKVAKNMIDMYLFDSLSAVVTSELRSEGLIYSFDSSRIDIGNLSFYFLSMQADHDRVDKVISVITRHLATVASDSVPEAELKDLRRYVQHILPTLLETSDDYLGWFERDIRRGTPARSIESEIAIAETISADEIVNAAREIFWNGSIFLLAGGNHKSGGWSAALSTMLTNLQQGQLVKPLIDDELATFKQAVSEAKTKQEQESRVFWWTYAIMLYLSAWFALKVQYLPLQNDHMATVSMFDVIYDSHHWIWGGLLFIPLLIGLAISFNFSEKVKHSNLVLALTASITTGAYIYGIFVFFGDIGKENAPFFWQDVASLLHPLTFLILTPVALYKAVSHILQQRRIKKTA